MKKRELSAGLHNGDQSRFEVPNAI
jgi:hypothetical protein